MRLVLHADADAFFAQVETILDPSLVGKPVIVGGPSNRGIVTSATYEARAMGVYTTMPIAQARRLCPKGVFVEAHFEAYGRFSKRMFEVFESFTPQVEGGSLDEAYLDFTGCERLHAIEGWGAMEEGRPGRVVELAGRLRDEVRRRAELRISIGAATSKLVAKVATDFGKPNGVTVVFPGREAAFLSPMPVGTVPGIG
ncbi:MAG: DNA polymerase IV, partial [Planctomycetota bacterium]